MSRRPFRLRGIRSTARALLLGLALVLLGTGTAVAVIDPAGILEVVPRYATDGILADAEFRLALEVQLKPGWHVNTDEPSYEFAIPTELLLEPPPDLEITEIVFPPPSGRLRLPDGGTTEIYSGTVHIFLRGRAAATLETGSHILGGTLAFQGCDENTCLRPAEKPFAFELTVLPPGTLPVSRDAGVFSGERPPTGGQGDSAEPGETAAEAGTDDVGTMVRERGLFVTLLLVFLGGLALNLTPCVYPLIPITISYFGGRKEGGNPVPSAIAYVLGICLMYSALGTVAAVTGKMFGALLANPVVLIVIAGFMGTLALSMFGLFEFRLPTALMNVGGSARGGVAGALLMGLTMGIVAAPCIGPFVVGLLTYVATQGNPWLGFILFFVLSLGLGTPYLVLGIFSGRISSLPRAGEWMVGVRRIFGVVLCAMAVYFLNPLLRSATYGILMGLVLALGGGALIILDRSGKDRMGFHVIKSTIALIMVATGIWLLKPTAEVVELSWAPYSEAAVVDARAAGTPVVIDFYADWCIPCKELDKLTFTDARVLALGGDFVFLKVDLSVDGEGPAAELKERYRIQGVPTIVFLGSDGRERPDLRLTGFEKPEAFRQRMDQALKSPPSIP